MKYVQTSKNSGHSIYHQFNFQCLYVLPTLYLCVSYLSQNKQRIFSFATLTDGICNRDLNIYSPVVTICTASKILKFYVLPTQCIYVFCVDLRTNSDHFNIEYYLTDIYNQNLKLYTSVVTMCATSLRLSDSTFCQLSVFLCFVWI